MTPNIIKYPFSKMVNLWPNASLIRINQNEDFFPEMKEGKATIFEHDIATTLYDLVQLKQQDQEVNNG
ncbi:hypothetical protein PTQ27_06120 [Mannheimia sp. AT1]|uniref:Uncharacterized protein n=1 Tax=Mannheimia cairinae TaxID=3025936 RepID=A0ABT5MPD4_9PAST|nr:hypothetical protein [Mannheimia cairinae]MDD0824039.1 hypothetical protein [Mannheimia cairinae]MDD0827155.1 hypothetical protein [Mannheimia cairinae]